MANVAGVSQLMETAVPATQTTPQTPAPEHSFATAMQQANNDAGLPVVTVEQKAQPTTQSSKSEADKNAGSQQESVHAQLPSDAVKMVDAAAGKAVPVATSTSLRYTPANMLAAMLAPVGVAAAAGKVPPTMTAGTARTALSSTGTHSQTNPAPALLPVDLPAAASTAVTVAIPNAPAQAAPTSSAPANTVTTLQTAALDAKPVDLSVPVMVLSVATPAGTAAQADGPQGHAVAKPAARRNDTLKAAETPPSVLSPTGVPSASVAVTPSSVTPTLAPVAVTSAVPATASFAGAALGAKLTAVSAATSINAVSTATRAATAVAPDAAQAFAPAPIQSGVSTQSTPSIVAGEQLEKPEVSLSFTVPAAAPLAASSVIAPSRPEPLLAAAGKLPVAASTTQRSVATVVAPETTPSANPQAAIAPQPSAAAIQSAPLLTTPAQTQLPTIQPPPAQQPSATVPKVSSKPSLSADAQPSTNTATQTAIQPSASSLSDNKSTPHAVAPVVPAASPASMNDVSPSIATTPMAHTPVAVTALSNATGPVLATTAPTALTSTTVADSVQHTTLTSTPTTLEVGVANGTHGWLKIRAELNASGTVDASLTGANEAATGRLHNDLPALSSFLQDEKVAVGSLNVSAPGAAVSALHATVAATLEPTSSFTRSAAEGVGATGTAVASDAGASGNRAPQQQAPETSPQVVVTREDDGVSRAVTPLVPALYGGSNELGGSGVLSEGSYDGGGSWLNVRV